MCLEASQQQGATYHVQGKVLAIAGGRANKNGGTHLVSSHQG